METQRCWEFINQDWKEIVLDRIKNGSTLGINYIQASQENIIIPLPKSLKSLRISQNMAAGLGGVAWDCVRAI